jgi:hypothetical protein
MLADSDTFLISISAFHEGDLVLGESLSNLLGSGSSHTRRLPESSNIYSMRSSASHSKEHLAAKELKLEATNRKATIVIEHIMQASDVSHTVGFLSLSPLQWTFDIL